MIRTSVVHSTRLSFSLPYGATLDTSSGEHMMDMPLDGAVSLYYALRDALSREGVALQDTTSK